MTPIKFSNLIQKDTEKTFNVLDHYKNLEIEQLKAIHLQDRSPLALSLLSLTGELNIASAIRSASLLGFQEVVLFGRRRYDRRGTVGAEHYIPVQRIGALKDDLSLDYDIVRQCFTSLNFSPIFFETGNYPKINEVDWRETINPLLENNLTPCLVFGSEGHGIAPEFLEDYPAQIFSIPQKGVLRSFNVSVAAAIAMWTICEDMRWL